MIVYEVVLEKKPPFSKMKMAVFFKTSKLKCMNEVAMDAS